MRVKKVSGSTTTVYIFSGTKVIAEYVNGAAPSAPTREYVDSGQVFAVHQSGTVKYHLRDHLSIRVTVDTSGAITSRHGHYPYGEVWHGQGPRWKFTSYERDDESGNDYATLRYYSSRLGRFFTPDLLAGFIVEPQSLNRYAYVVNDPTNLADPLGLWPDCLLDITRPCTKEELWGAGAWLVCEFNRDDEEVVTTDCYWVQMPHLGGLGPRHLGKKKPANNGTKAKCIPRSSLPLTTRATLSVLSWMARRSGGVRALGVGGLGAFSPPSLAGGGAAVQALWIADYLGQQGLYWSVSGGPTIGQAGAGGIGGVQYMTSTFNTTVTVQDVVNSSLSAGGAVGAGFAVGADVNLQTGVFTETIGFGVGGFGGAPASLNIASGFIPICDE